MLVNFFHPDGAAAECKLSLLIPSVLLFSTFIVLQRRRTAKKKGQGWSAGGVPSSNAPSVNQGERNLKASQLHDEM